MTANNPEAALYRAPTFSLLVLRASHGGIIVHAHNFAIYAAPGYPPPLSPLFLPPLTEEGGEWGWEAGRHRGEEAASPAHPLTSSRD